MLLPFSAEVKWQRLSGRGYQVSTRLPARALPAEWVQGANLCECEIRDHLKETGLLHMIQDRKVIERIADLSRGVAREARAFD